MKVTKWGTFEITGPTDILLNDFTFDCEGVEYKTYAEQVKAAIKLLLATVEENLDATLEKEGLTGKDQVGKSEIYLFDKGFSEASVELQNGENNDQ